MAWSTMSSRSLLEWFSGLSASRMHALRIVTLAYAAVFAVEGVGLWMQKRWAEWLTTIITASLIPLEAWEIFFRPTIGKVLIIVANLAVVAYLVWHVRTNAGLAKARLGACPGTPTARFVK